MVYNHFAMPGTEQIHLLDRLLDPIAESLNGDAARRLISLRADAATQARIDQLATKRNEGTISDEELSEYSAYVSAGTVIAILQAKARRLAAKGATA